MSETNARKAHRNSIRHSIRERRRALGVRDQRAAAAELRNHLLALPRFRHTRNIAAYVAVDGEIPLDPVIETAWSLDIPVYLPCLRGQRMEFRRYTPHTLLRDNRFGIPEPENTPGARINARFLDLVLTPLVAFDTNGGRLGTGGGFYDRTFAFLRQRAHWKQPALLGIAYEFQLVPEIPIEAWDIPMRGVVTDVTTRIFKL